jgi:hypothetical protein
VLLLQFAFLLLKTHSEFQQTRYASFQAAILLNTCIDSFGGGIR